MSINTRIHELATTIANICKDIYAKQGDLTTLTTTDKATIVGAINEVHASAATLNDTLDTSTTETWSIDRINSEIIDKITGMFSGLHEDFDTLTEISLRLLDLANVEQGLLYPHQQTFTEIEKQHFQNNIGLGDDIDFVTLFTTTLNP